MAAHETFPASQIPEVLKLIESFNSDEQASHQINHLKQCVFAANRCFHVETRSSHLFSADNLERLGNAAQHVIQAAIVPPFESRNYFSYGEEDFEWFPEVGELVLRLIYELTIFCKQYSSEHSTDEAEVGPRKVENHTFPWNKNFSWLYPNQLNLMILIAAHFKGKLWSTAKTQQISNDLLLELLIIHNVSTVDKFLTAESTCNLSPERKRANPKNDKSSLLVQVMQFCKVPLGKEQWQRNPFVAEAFSWTVLNTKPGHLCDNIDQVMAISLNFVDDHQPCNKVRGIELMHHLLLNTSSEEMRWFNRAEVIYESLKHQLYSKEAHVLEMLLSCLFSLLQIIEPRNSHAEINRHHEIYETLLRETESENLLEIRRVYITQMKNLTLQMGVGCVRHLRALVGVIEQYLEVKDGPQDQARCDALALLHTIIVIAWPRIHKHAQRIVQFLFKFLLDINLSDGETQRMSSDIKSHMNKQVVIIFKLLTQAVPDVQACLSTLKDLPSFYHLEPILKEIHACETT